MSRRALLAGLGLIAALVGAPVEASSKGDTLGQILRTGVIRVAVPDNFPPFGDLSPEAKPQGYDIDTATLVAEALGVKLDLVPVSSGDRIPYLTDRKVDLVIASLGKDTEREKVIDFSIAYAPFFSGVFGPDQLPVAKPEDLAGKTVAVTRDTIEDAVLTNLAPATATIQRYDDNADTEMAFLSSRAELIATGNVIATEALVQSPLKRTVVKFLLRNSPCYVGVNKGEPDLLARVDAIIAAALRDGRLDRISQRWLKAPLGNPEHPGSISAR